MRGSETVQVIPQVKTDRLRDPVGVALPEYDLKDCHVLPRTSREEGKGIIGVDGWTVIYFGKEDVERTSRLRVRGEVHNIDGKPQDYVIRGRRKGLIINTLRVS